jgi:hypothetical protein
MGRFRYDSVPELNNKNLGNSPKFLSVTHTTLSTKRFRSYGILKIDFTAEFCFWTEQRLNGTQLLGLRLAVTPKILNTITVGNSVMFPMVHNTAPNSQQFMSYDCQKLDQSTESEIWADCTFPHKSRVWQIFAMTYPETLNMKFTFNKLSFLLVTHMSYSDARFDSYMILKSEHFLDRLDIQANDKVSRA